MRSLYLFLLCCLFITYSGCREGLSDCFTRTGKQTAEETEVAPFRTLYVNDGLHIKLVQGSRYRVTVRAGSHIIGEIRATSEEGELMLTDEIGCDWSRRYEPKEVTVECPDLRTVYQNGYGSITADETLTYDSLSILPRYGQGSVTLDVQAKYVEVTAHRNSTVTLTGETDYLLVNLMFEMPVFDGRDLQAQKVDIAQVANNHMYLYPIHSLRGRIMKKGNVYLYHQPELIQVDVQGKGRIIDRF